MQQDWQRFSSYTFTDTSKNQKFFKVSQRQQKNNLLKQTISHYFLIIPILYCLTKTFHLQFNEPLDVNPSIKVWKFIFIRPYSKNL